MLRTLLSVAVVGGVAANLSAQCVAPSGTQTLETLFAGTTFYANLTPPNYGVSMDPGSALRFDLTVDSPISISSVGVNVLNDGGCYGGAAPNCVPCPNLVGAPNGTLEFWVIPGDTVTNAVNFTANTYTHVPPVGPNAPWTRLDSGTGNLVFAAPDTPSLATYAPPINLAVGTYAVVLVMVPSGTNSATDRIHPLFTNVNNVPTPLVVDDGFVKFEHGGIQSPAFVNGALQYNSPTPYIPNIQINYSLGANVAYQTQYGAGCYDRKQSFYEGFAPPGTATPGSPTDLASGGIGGLTMFNLGNQYLVQTTGATYPLGGVTPGSTAHFTGLTPTHVNTANPGTALWADWDDSTSVVYTMPFTFNYPGDGGVGTNQLIIGSNGAIWLGGTQPTAPRFLNSYAAWLLGPPSFAVSYCDLWPADLVTFTGGTGNIFCDSDGSSYVTVSWVGVQEYPNGANFGQNNNFQIRLSNTGNVDIAYGNQAFSNSDLLVGFTPGNNAPDPGSGATGSPGRQKPDFSVAAAGPGYISGDGANPADISLDIRPKVGNNLIITVDNVDPTSAANITVISTASLPGPDLGFIGMPGCGAWVTLPEILSNFTLGAGPYTWNVGTIQPAFAGISLYAQAVQLTVAVPPWNSLNWLTSNAVCFHMNVN
jgi:hypothetical protein